MSELIEGFTENTDFDNLTQEQFEKLYDYLHKDSCKLNDFVYDLKGFANMIEFMANGLEYEVYPEASLALSSLANSAKALSDKYNTIYEELYDNEQKQKLTIYYLHKVTEKKKEEN